MVSQPAPLTEARLRQIVQHEMVLHVLMQEGLWDDVKVGVQKLRAAVSQKFGNIIQKWAAALKKLGQVDSAEAREGFQALRQAMSESGESFSMDAQLRAAQRLAQLGEAGHMEIVQSELQGPVHDLAAQLQNGTQREGRYLAGLYDLLVTEAPDESELLREFGVTAAVGMGLAAFGGAHLLFQGLAKLAGYLKMTRTQELFTHWAHALHHTEEKALDKVVPNRLAYVFMRTGSKVARKIIPGLVRSKEEMPSFEEFIQDDKMRIGIKQAIYKLLLTYLLINGIAGAVHAGMSVLGVAEGAASTVKGIEIAGGLRAAAGAVKNVAG